MIDLHTHSTASDGVLSPRNLIRKAKEKGLCAIALTDHDTIDGVEEAADEAANTGIKFIAGTELEIEWNTPEAFRLPENKEFHLLGLNLKNPSAGFLKMMSDLKIKREKRNHLMIDKMRNLGFDADYEELRKGFSGCIGRPHFAKYLLQLKAVKTVQQAFDNYLGKGKSLYVQKESVEFEEAAVLIKESGGISVLAHPSSLYVSWGRMPEIISLLKDKGLDGVEAWHPLFTKHAAQRMEAIAKEFGLRITAGSDFHGELRPDRKIGHTAGGIKIGDQYLAAIL